MRVVLAVSISPLALVLATCADARPAADPPRAATITVALDTQVAEIDPRFVSFAVDTAQLVGGTFWSPSAEVEVGTGRHRVAPYDFSRPRLRVLAAALAPAYLRIGGSDADKTFYDLSDMPRAEPPEGYAWVLTRAEWDGMHDFVDALGLELVFTLGAGPGPRLHDGRWDESNARTLLTYARDAGHAIALLELGNEPNAFSLIHGLGFSRTGREHASDLRAMRALAHELLPDARIGGPASAYWPLLGEPAAVGPDVMAEAGDALDAVSWHYYPMQSRRCPIATRRATLASALSVETLTELDTWADEVGALRDAHAPAAELWLGESGPAQCGGEPGLGQSFAGTFGWLDQLGRLARRGYHAVVRQTLSGSDYGLVDDETLEPRPDYWASLLFRRLMGTRVLAATSDEDGVLAYAHCAREGAGDVVVLLLNPGDTPGDVTLSGDITSTASHTLWLATASAPEASEVRIDGAPLRLEEGAERMPEIEGAVLEHAPLRLPPTSWAFVRVRADAAACR